MTKKSGYGDGADRDMIGREPLLACVWRFQMAERGRRQELQDVPLTHLDSC